MPGIYVCEHLRINLKFLSPSIQTYYLEAKFRFDEPKTDLNSIQCQYIFLSEDCSTINLRTEYGSNLDTFNSFVTPVIDGVPHENYLKCKSFEQLKLLLKTKPRANLINVHLIQQVSDSDVSVTPSATAS